MGQQVIALMVGIDDADRFLDADGEWPWWRLPPGQSPRHSDVSDSMSVGFAYAISGGALRGCEIIERTIPVEEIAAAYPDSRSAAARRWDAFAAWVLKHCAITLPPPRLLLTVIEVGCLLLLLAAPAYAADGGAELLHRLPASDTASAAWLLRGTCWWAWACAVGLLLPPALVLLTAYVRLRAGDVTWRIRGVEIGRSQCGDAAWVAVGDSFESTTWHRWLVGAVWAALRGLP